MNLNAYQNIESLSHVIYNTFGFLPDRERGYTTKYEDGVYPVINVLDLLFDDHKPKYDKHQNLDYDIKIHCRCGGGNRDCYENTEKIAQSELCVLDIDDDFDCTYRDLYIKITDEKLLDFIKSYDNEIKKQ